MITVGLKFTFQMSMLFRMSAVEVVMAVVMKDKNTTNKSLVSKRENLLLSGGRAGDKSTLIQPF